MKRKIHKTIYPEPMPPGAILDSDVLVQTAMLGAF
jgi:hypothetical protein